MRSKDVRVESIRCFNDHGEDGQVMKSNPTGGYMCPECGRVAEYALTWADPEESNE